MMDDATPSTNSSPLLDRAIWVALTTSQAHLAEGGDAARRYPAALAPIAAVAEFTSTAFTQLASLLNVNEIILLSDGALAGIVGELSPELPIVFRTWVVQMICPTPPSLLAVHADSVTLDVQDAEAMQALVALTDPGPFAERTYELGCYLGIKVAGQLVAMAGERMQLPGYREISAVCTHPAFVGRGYARHLVAQLVQQQARRGERAFLHVEETNERAITLYKGLGFTARCRIPVLAVQRRA